MQLNEYQDNAITTAVYPGRGSPLGLIYVALKMNGEAGEFAEHVGKALRDDNYMQDELTPERNLLLKKELGDVLWYIAAAAKELGFTLDEIAVANNAKLADRKARGVLAGSGDNR